MFGGSRERMLDIGHDRTEARLSGKSATRRAHARRARRATSAAGSATARRQEGVVARR
jgi:hypothetical protein